MKEIEHPNVLKVVDFISSEHEDVTYLIMDYIKFPSL